MTVIKRMTKKPCLPGRAHWWIIEPPSGASSFGRCKYCKQRQEFVNSVQHHVYSQSLGDHNRIASDDEIVP